MVTKDQNEKDRSIILKILKSYNLKLFSTLVVFFIDRSRFFFYKSTAVIFILTAWLIPVDQYN
jgi:hypothetical protein